MEGFRVSIEDRESHRGEEMRLVTIEEGPRAGEQGWVFAEEVDE